MITIGRYIQQRGNFKAFIPDTFPPNGLSYDNAQTIRLLSEANLLVGKLDGITRLLPDINFFIFMYIKKESAYSSQIEGTKARLTDALLAEVEKTAGLPDDVDDILHYINATHEGLRQLETLPLSLRVIKEIHRVLLSKTRSSTYPYPGEFKRSQNWVMGTSPADARFVPAPPEYMVSAMGDLEEFFYSNQDIPVLIKVALIHSQFETIHPFIDGNGRVGRLLVTLYLCQEKVLEKPVLYLSEYFRKHREVYFAMLDEYRKGNITEWLEFFLKGVISIAKQAIETLDRIIDLREKDLHTVSTLGRASKNAIVLLKNLYKLPMVNVRKIQEFTSLSREAANRLAKRFVELGLLHAQEKEKKYARIFVYKEYLDLFEK
ncbi:Protein adenylyltransferase SoFic [subsurface metagenome]|jgi:Fic family protein